MASRNVRQTHSGMLKDLDVACEYINEALESDDPAVVLMALRNIAEAQEDGIAGLAERASLDRESINKMLSSSGNPELSSFVKLMHGLGLKIQVMPDTANKSQRNIG